VDKINGCCEFDIADDTANTSDNAAEVQMILMKLQTPLPKGKSK
jgi:hypothetical protein